MQTYSVVHLFAGIGGGALGFQQAEVEFRGVTGRFHTLCGIDVNRDACEDFRNLTGAPAVQMDLFSPEDYEAFHGRKPPADWRAATPEDLRAAAGGIAPDVLFTSPPCKGFSGLLPRGRSESEKYQALNRLTFRSIWLALEAWRDDPPGLILLENVPRITVRGERLLRDIKRLLAAYGYLCHEGYHDCGELGGLAQHRRRYLLVARNQRKVPMFLYQPPKQRVRSLGEVIGPIPLPDDPAGGPLHRLPRLQWRTWVRLALIPAGGDWRDLKDIRPEQYRIVPADGRHNNVERITGWDQPAGTVAGGARPSQGAISVADPRLGCSPRNAAYRIIRWDEPSLAVTGAGDIHSQGAAAVADPRIPGDSDRGVWIIIAEDGTWHRPLTTLELAALQGFPVVMPDGRPLTLAGKSDARWRERIGNAVPPPAAGAIAEQALLMLLRSAARVWEASATPVWVHPTEQPVEAVGD